METLGISIGVNCVGGTELVCQSGSEVLRRGPLRRVAEVERESARRVRVEWRD